IDLVPRENVEAWLKYLRNEFPTVAFKASTQQQRTNLGQARGGSGKTKGGAGPSAPGESQVQKSESVGADALIQLLKNYCRNANIKTAITVGVIGYPNVGKSSLINSLRRSRVCQVGSTPGITKAIQEIHLDKHVKLLDSPGIVFAKPVNATKNTTTGVPDKASQTMADVVLRNCIKVELLDDPIAPVEAIVARCNPKHLMVFYNLPFFGDHKEFLVQLARQRGRLGPGGIPNLKAAAQIVLNDWNVGRIQFYTEPPATHGKNTRPAEIVKGWSEEFQLADITGTIDSEILAGAKSKSQLSRTTLSMAADVHSGDRQLMTEEEIEAMVQSSSGESELDSEMENGDSSMYDSDESAMSDDEPVDDRPVLRVNAEGRTSKNKNQTDG
ncbi:nuclear GTP-binding protein nug1, partial [Dispira simplex]